MIDLTALLNIVAPVGAATILGGIVGLERELQGRWARLRTHMMVAMGAAMFVVAGASSSPS